MAENAIAKLEFEITSKIFESHPLQVSETVPFHFTNTGSEAVSILELKPGCGCTSGKVDKREYAPGESGTVYLTFNLEKRQGAQRKGISVKTDDGSKPIDLYVSTNIPKTYSSSVKRLIWNAGENRDAKNLVLRSTHKEAIKLEKAVPSQEGIIAELKPVREGFEYELVITPSEEISNSLVKITVYPKAPAGMDQTRTYIVYALVK